MATKQITRTQLNERLQELRGAVISYTLPKGDVVCGIVQHIAVESMTGEMTAIFQINHKRYEADILYFVDNTIINGSTQRGSNRTIRGICKGD